VSTPGTIEVDSSAGRGILASTVLASGMVFLDSSITNVAIKQIGIDFSASFATLQWVLNGYTLALASLILLGGSLGDQFGRRRVYLIGVVWFATASLLCALAPSSAVLVAARVLQGMGGALLTPGSLALIQASFAPSNRSRAVGIWSGVSGVSTALGPLLGGYLVQHVSWRWAFGINVPFAVAVVVLGSRHIPESKSSGAGARLDIAGTALVAAGLGGLTYGATRAGGDGWGPAAISSVAVGLVLLALFVLLESRLPDPLLPLRLFASRTFAGANIMTFMTYGSLSSVLFLFVLNLQVSGHYGALAAGLATLPVTFLLLVLSPRAGALSARIGPRLPMAIGPVIAATGIALTARIDERHHDYVMDVLPGMAVFGLGLACLVAPLTATVMAAAPPDQVGIASAVNNAVARSASLLAVAVLPSLAGLTGERYRVPATMTQGYRTAVTMCAVILILGAIAVLLTVSSEPAVSEEARDDAGDRAANSGPDS
jgi:EmrB/QacA subfamily drug resistance transporter